MTVLRLVGGLGFLTARQRQALRVVACVAADDGYDDIEAHGGAPVTQDGDWALFDLYPPLTWGQDTTWRRQAARAFDDLAADLAAGGCPRPRCTAEEMALHLMVEQARDLHADGVLDEALAGIPESVGDGDWEQAREQLIEDCDVLELFDPALAAAGPELRAAVLARIGVNLHPPAWFQPFAPAQARDSGRGFRR